MTFSRLGKILKTVQYKGISKFSCLWLILYTRLVYQANILYQVGLYSYTGIARKEAFLLERLGFIFLFIQLSEAHRKEA